MALPHQGSEQSDDGSGIFACHGRPRLLRRYRLDDECHAAVGTTQLAQLDRRGAFAVCPSIALLPNTTFVSGCDDLRLSTGTGPIPTFGHFDNLHAGLIVRVVFIEIYTRLTGPPAAAYE
jgi:hypothetical protein